MTTAEAERYGKQLAEFLRLRALNLRVSQQRLAEAAGVTRQTMNDWLNGKTFISITALIDVCPLLNLTPAQALEAAKHQTI